MSTGTLSPFPTRRITVDLPNGSSWLHVVELDKTVVTTKYARTRKKIRGDHGPLYSLIGEDRNDVAFSAQDFFHAIAKADLALAFTAHQAQEHAEEMWVHCRSLFDWAQQPLRLMPRMARYYKSHSLLAGQIGEGMALLLMHLFGYPWWDHAETVLKRAGGASVDLDHDESLQTVPGSATPRSMPATTGSTDDDDESERHADFVCEKQDGSHAIAEAKGSFVTPRSIPPVKRHLADAIEQVTALTETFGVVAAKTYAISTYLRERDDSSWEPSLVAFTDPPGRVVGRDDFPSDWVRRGNYGSWLIGMGFIASGVSLRSRQERKLTPICLPVISVAGHDFAFTVKQCSAQALVPLPGMIPTQRCRRDNTFCLSDLPLFYSQPYEVVIYGLEVSRLAAIAPAIANAADRSLLKILSLQMDVQKSTGAVSEPWLDGSIFSDGSLYGVLRPQLGKSFEIRMVEFEL